MERWKVLLVLGALVTSGVIGDLLLREVKRYPTGPSWRVDGGDPLKGRRVLVTYGCTGCHVVPGVRAPSGRVGPKLEGIRDQMYIGGVLPNTPENMVSWIRNPRKYSPRTAMPDLGVSEQDARDIAAYLYQLR